MRKKSVGQDSSKREKKARNIVESIIDKTPLLNSAFPSNDKTILYDGFINLYSNSNICNENYLGKVAVQIKSMSEREYRNKNGYVNISIPRVYLQAYFRDGGVLFFKVLLDEYLECKNIFYVALTKIELNRLLRCNKKKYVSVPFKVLPAELDAVQDIVFYFHSNIVKQASFNPESFIGIDELKERVLAINVSCEKNKLLAMMRRLKKGDTYLYCKTERDIEIPIDFIPCTYSLVPESVDCGLFIDGECFYDKCSIVKHGDDLVFVFEDSISLILHDSRKNEGKVCFTLTYCLPDYLDDAVHTLTFLKKAICEKGKVEMYIQDSVEYFYVSEKDKDQIDTVRRVYEDFSQVREVLSWSGLNKRIEIRKMKEEEILNFIRLYSIFKSGKETTSYNPAPIVCECLSFGGYKIVVAAIKKKNDKYCLSFDFYSVVDDSTSSIMKPLPMFFYLSQYVDFWLADNVDYERVFSIVSTIDLDLYLTEIVIMTLNLILVYDSCHKKEVMDLSIQILNFLIENTKEENKNYLFINKYQCLKRIGKLGERDKKELEMIAENTLSNEEKTACYALLDKNELVVEYFKRISDKEKFLKFPIAFFIKAII